MTTKTIYIEPPKGFQIVCIAKIDNDIYFDINNHTIELPQIDGFRCILKSADKGKLISESETLKFVIGNFESNDAAKASLHNIKGTISYYLSLNRCSFKLKFYIRNLSAVELTLEGSAKLSVMRPLYWGNSVMLNSQKVENALALLQRAEQIQHTEIAFMLYVVVLESLLDDEAQEKKEGKIIQLIEATQDFIEQNEASADIKSTLICNLENLKTLGSRNAVKKMISRLCGKETYKVNGRDVKYTSIYNECYNKRNLFAHQGIAAEDINLYIEAIRTISYEVVLKHLQNEVNILHITK